ncbi:hypothetical protein V5O48_003211 [Marasmius crinis-equi]|uniref:NAD(P)-binding protein n=1 Tax=Marasmius crinis-equi TaxID=585013 RepID=A0ABR3FTI6_9AGAR
MSSQSKSRTILITGANTGIGYELVRQLASQGHNVYLSSRSEGSGKDARGKLRSEHGLEVKYVQIDVTSEESIKLARDAIEKEEGKLDVLVNNAGRFSNGMFKPSELTPANMHEILDTNYYGVIRVTTAFIPLIRKAQNGVILNVSSQVGSHTSQSQLGRWPPHLVAYYSSKAILNAYTISLAKELKDEGIRVNSGTPGLTSTNLDGVRDITSRPASEGAACLLPLILIDPEDKTKTEPMVPMAKYHGDATTAAMTTADFIWHGSRNKPLRGGVSNG